MTPRAALINGGPGHTAADASVSTPEPDIVAMNHGRPNIDDAAASVHVEPCGSARPICTAMARAWPDNQTDEICRRHDDLTCAGMLDCRHDAGDSAVGAIHFGVKTNTQPGGHDHVRNRPHR